MPYLVKAVSTSGIVTWLHCGASGVRCISIREDAETFQAVEDAESAIARMPPAFEAAGIRFSVVDLDDEVRATG
jgi:hypothetical protein